MTLAKEAARTYSPAQLSELTKAFEGSIEDITSSLVNNGYSRELEREADKGAITILTRAGYDPGALVAMLIEMQKQWKPGGPGFAKTHPEPKDRIAEIKPVVMTVAAKPVAPARQKRFEAALSGV
jgi:predicted Zn-dependent protease